MKSIVSEENAYTLGRKDEDDELVIRSKGLNGYILLHFSDTKNLEVYLLQTEEDISDNYVWEVKNGDAFQLAPEQIKYEKMFQSVLDQNPVFDGTEHESGSIKIGNCNVCLFVKTKKDGEIGYQHNIDTNGRKAVRRYANWQNSPLKYKQNPNE